MMMNNRTTKYVLTPAEHLHLSQRHALSVRTEHCQMSHRYWPLKVLHCLVIIVLGLLVVYLCPRVREPLR